MSAALATISLVILALQAAPKPREEAAPDTAPFDPVIRQIEGFTIHVDPKLLQGEHAAGGAEAYFDRNDFYPFVRAELKEHDPVLHDLLQEIWGIKK